MAAGVVRQAVLAGLAVILATVGAARAGAPKEGPAVKAPSVEDNVTQGALRVKQKDGSIVECPLKRTDVKAEVSGFIARVKVTQTFSNPYDEPIEAVYVFPLPNQAAVDEMTMVIGTRRIVGVIKRRAQARQIYEAALAAGMTAALLEQERPNIFTQSVGNIQPKQDVKIEISYVDVLKYDMGVYSFHFPMVVGPRYIPGTPTSPKPPVPDELKGKVGEVPGATGEGAKGTGWAPDTERVPDASRITPPVLKPGFRTGHDISLAVNLEAGVPIQDLKIPNHKADVKRDGPSRATIVMDQADSIPNKDFVLEYAVVGKKPEMALLCHAPANAAGRGYFMLMVQPKEDEKLKQAPPREVFFLVDVSGSMGGQPIAKSKEAMRCFFRQSKKDDRMQVIKFASNSQALWETPQPVDDKTIEAGLAFVDQMEGGGGTEMLKGIKMVLEAPPDPKRVRIVIMLTDGFIGNEAEIIKEVGQKAGDRIRFWTIGIGSSPNRFLLDGVAKQGGGMSKVLGLNDKPDELVQEIVMRIHRAQLADIKINWGRLAVEETYPAKVPELWAGRPIILFGRYEGPGSDTVQVTGNVEGEKVAWPLQVTLLKDEPEHDVLAKVWARNKIESLMDQSFYQDPPEVVEAVTKVALEYRLMSQYTSFVAVDETSAPLAPPANPPRRMVVPVPLPEGVRYEGIFGPPGWGEMTEFADAPRMAMPSAPPPMAYAPSSPGIAAAPRPGRIAGGKFDTTGKDRLATRFDRRLAEAGRGRSRALAQGKPAGGMGGVMRSSVMAADEEVTESYARIPMAPTTRPAPELGDYRVSQAFYGDAAKRQEAAKKACDEAEALRKKGDLQAAYFRFQAAYLLDVQGDVSDTAQEALADLGKAIEAVQVKALPALDKKLDLVIRDRSLEEALADLGKAAGVDIKIAAGALIDAKMLLMRQDLRVTYLDLRNATAAQALTWLLNPFYLTWRVDGQTVAVTTSRRLAGEAPWTYDATLLAIPLADELGKDGAKAAEAAKKAADEFLDVVRRVAPNAQWLEPGRLFVVGPAKTHEDVANLLLALTDDDARLLAKVADVIGEKQVEQVKSLRATTMKRYAARKKAQFEFLAARDKAECLGTLVEFSWKLLAEATSGKAEDETLTELRIAWANPKMREYANTDATTLVARSFWIAAEAAGARKTDADLQALFQTALKADSGNGYEAALDRLEKNPADAGAYLGAVYAQLAARTARMAGLVGNPSPLRGEGRVRGAGVDPHPGPLPERERGDSGPFDARFEKAMAAAKENPVAKSMRPVVTVLLGTPDAAAVKALVEFIGKGVAGPDAVLLTALAARKAGGDAWEQFRADAKDLLGKQPLPGAVVVTVSNLASANLPSAKRGA